MTTVACDLHLNKANLKRQSHIRLSVKSRGGGTLHTNSDCLCGSALAVLSVFSLPVISLIIYSEIDLLISSDILQITGDTMGGKEGVVPSMGDSTLKPPVPCLHVLIFL